MVSHVWAWAKCLLFRWPWNIPKQLLGAWLLLVVLAFVIGFFFLQTIIPEGWRVVDVPKWGTGLASLLVTVVAVPVLKNIIGDAARYLNPAPGNIKQRQEIRLKGVKLIQALHKKGYARIIIAGHSLGSVIGYDILTHAWALYNDKGTSENDHPAMTALETLAADTEFTVDEYQFNQSEMLGEMVNNDYTWRVTDFVTMGSPLAHATVLLSKDRNDLVKKQVSREFPTCPPELEKERFSYPPERAHRPPHHAAVFAPTRWTNLYFPSRFVVWGDLIGGPVRTLFGRGIKDVPVESRQRFGLLSHTLYWKSNKTGPTTSHIKALRDALTLAAPCPPYEDAEQNVKTP